MDLSVVICTRNRADRLPELFEKLRNLKEPGVAWEMVFVDNNSSDNTLAVLKNFASHSPVSIQVVLARKDGLSNARNAGIRAARGAIISFTDDDCYPQEDWLIAVVKTFKESDAGFIGGRVLLFDADDAPITIQTSMQPVTFKAKSYIESGEIIGANLSCTKELLNATGGFDPYFGAGTSLQSGEDTDILNRASLLGYIGLYDPSIVVLHHHRRKIGSDVVKLYRGYAYGRGALSMKAVLDSNWNSLYVKNWYWRLRSLLKKRQFDYCWHEFRGAMHFMRSRWFGPNLAKSSAPGNEESVPESWQFDGCVNEALPSTKSRFAELDANEIDDTRR